MINEKSIVGKFNCKHCENLTCQKDNSIREGFTNHINYFRGIFREGERVTPIRENNQFFPTKEIAKSKSVQNALKHVIK